MSSKIDPQLFSNHSHSIEHQACPECHETLGGELQLRHGKHGPFLGCNQYPQCNYIRPLHQNDGHIVKALGVECPQCNSQQHSGELVLRQGRYGMFVGCSRFPDCQHVEPLTQTQPAQAEQAIDCPECHTGHLVERKSRYGKSFFACDDYPKCKFSINFPPVEGICDECGFPLLVKKSLQSGDKILCADRKCQHQQMEQ